MIRKHVGVNVFALSLALILAIVSTCPQLVYGGHWAETSLDYAARNQLLPTIYKSRHVRENLDAPIPRSAVVSLLVHGIGEPVDSEEIEKTGFADWKDVPKQEGGYIAAAKRLGILEGSLRKTGLYALPKQNITRQEASAMIARALGMQIDDTAGFKDDEKIAAWAQSAVTGMKKGAVLQGDQKGYFNPEGTLTWGQMMRILETAHLNNKLKQPAFQVMAGNGVQGHLNGAVGHSQTAMPRGVTADAKGVVYFADYGNSVVRSVQNGQVADYAGGSSPQDLYNLKMGGYVDGEKSKALLSKAVAVKAVNGGILVADSGNHAIRLISGSNVTTFAGSKTAGYKDGDKKNALFNSPMGLTVDTEGNVFVADTANQVIRKIDLNGKVTTAAGVPRKAGFADGKAEEALLCEPMGLAFYEGGLYIADSGNNRVRLLKDGKLTTYAGGGLEQLGDGVFLDGDYADGPVLTARFDSPKGLAFDKDGALYVADSENGMIRKVKDGTVSTFCGFGTPTNAKAPLLANYLVEPYDVLVLDNRIVVSDNFTNYLLSFPMNGEGVL